MPFSTKYFCIEHHSVCPLFGIGTPPTPLPQASVPSPPPGPKGGGVAHSPAVKGVGESHFRRLENKLSSLYRRRTAILDLAAGAGKKKDF